MRFQLWAPGFTGFGGGIAAFSRELATGLRDLGHEVRLVGKLDETGVWQGFPLAGGDTGMGLWGTPKFAARALWLCTRDRPDHIISSHLNFGPLALLAKRILRVPYTLVAHGVEVHPGLPQRRLDPLRAADQILAVSSWTRRRVMELGNVEAERVALLPDTFDEDRFSVRAYPEGLAQRYRLEGEERVVLTVARLDSSEAYKGYDRVLGALPAIQAACGPVRFIVVGRGNDRARLETLAREQGVADSVTFAGFVPDEELPDHYRLADVFVMPSTGEGFGIVFLEAMACGTPVLGGNWDGSVDALDAGELGRLVDPNDVDAIAEGVVALLRRQGPAWWFDRAALHGAVTRRFGRAAFRETLQTVVNF